MTDRTRRRGDQRPQAGKDQLDQWRQARADRNRDQRNKRGRRPGPPITGIRIPPPPKGTTP